MAAGIYLSLVFFRSLASCFALFIARNSEDVDATSLPGTPFIIYMFNLTPKRLIFVLTGLNFFLSRLFFA